jgi:hypothetical protein
MQHIQSSCHANTSAIIIALPHAAVAGVQLPLVLLPHAALQLPTGCTPPPAAFFLLEQLLKGVHANATVTVATHVLQGSVEVLEPAVQQQQQQQQQQSSTMHTQARQAGAAELQRLAYSSLASSVVQTVLYNAWILQRSNQGVCAQQVLQLAAQLVQAAVKEAATLSSSGSNNSVRGVGRGRRRKLWGLAASLAAATAASAYVSHLDCSSAAQGVAPHKNSSCSSNSAAGGDVRERVAFMLGTCSVGCGVCASAAQVFLSLRCLEEGWVGPPCTPAAAAAAASAHAEAARRYGLTTQQHLAQQLMDLAGRHPVPGVCGNLMCGSKDAAAAVGLVRGPVRTLCGGCRAVWYCCEECQQVAWAAHRVVCRRRR